MLIRRLLLITLVLFCLSLVLQGCATQPVCAGPVVWKQVSADQMRGFCGFDWSAACVLGDCLVVSKYSMEEAARIRGKDGRTLLSHELRHTEGEEH